MMRRLLPHPLLTAVLVVVWLLLNNSLAPGQLALGLLLGVAIPLFAEPFWPERVCIRRPLTLAALIAVVLYDILIANLVVARLIVGRPGRLRPAFVIVPLALRSDLAISLLANTITLTPGTISAELSPDRRSLVVHALDAPDPDRLVADIKARYEGRLVEVFESC